MLSCKSITPKSSFYQSLALLVTGIETKCPLFVFISKKCFIKHHTLLRDRLPLILLRKFQGREKSPTLETDTG